MTCAQFNHRNLAYFTWTLAMVIFALYRRNVMVSPSARRGVWALAFMVNLQLFVGITMLLQQVPLKYGCIHQANGLLTLTSAIYLVSSVRNPNKMSIAHLLKKANLSKLNNSAKILSK